MLIKTAQFVTNRQLSLRPSRDSQEREIVFSGAVRRRFVMQGWWCSVQTAALSALVLASLHLVSAANAALLHGQK